MIGMRALGRGLTSKLVSCDRQLELPAQNAAGTHALQQVSNHRDEKRGVQASFRIVNEDDEVHV